MRDTRKHRRQQGEKEREAEIARAEAADLAAQLRKVMLPEQQCLRVSCLADSLTVVLAQAEPLMSWSAKREGCFRPVRPRRFTHHMSKRKATCGDQYSGVEYPRTNTRIGRQPETVFRCCF